MTLAMTLMQTAPLALAAICMIATTARLLDAYDDRRALIAARRRGLSNDPLLLLIVNAGCRREWLRLAKHTIVVGAIYLALDVYDAPTLFVWMLFAIGLALMLNSVEDYRLQRRVIGELERRS